MKVTEEGTTNIIKWYQPESSEECKSIDCRRCAYYSYVPSSSSCPFEAWMINHPVKELSTQEIVTAAKRHGFGEPSSSTSNIVMVLNEINQNIIKSIELQQEPDNPKMVFKLEEQPCDDCVGSLDTLSYVCVGRKNLTSREYYHHCPKQRGRLIRLEYSYERKEEFCPVCGQVFVSK